MKDATYSVKEMSKLSGVSVRTLHYYEQIGLLQPARRPNGYRIYVPKDVQRLQQILLYRTCGMELSAIKGLMDSPHFDAGAALERHLVTLSARKEELERLIATVEKTIASLEGMDDMNDAERFEGLKHEAVETNEREYGVEAREHYGDDVIDAVNEKLLGMDAGEWEDMKELEGAIVEQLNLAMKTGDMVGSEAHKLCEMHERWLRMQWSDGAYSRPAHLADPRFVAYYDDAAGNGATRFLCDALTEYCK